MNGRADCPSCVRAARDRSKWKIGIAQFELHFLKRHTELLGRDLRQRCVSAGAEIVPGALHGRAAVSAQDHFCSSFHLVRRIRFRRHAPADEQITIAHGAWLRIAFGPAEFLRADLVALLQVFRAKWNIFDRMVVCVIR